MSRILLIEDDPIVRESLSEVLANEGHIVTERESAEDVEELVAQQRFDVIVTDLKLPGASGLELVRSLNNKPIDAEIVIITGYGTMESAIDALKLGVFDFVNKPFETSSILNTIRNAAEKVELRRQKSISDEIIRTLKEFNEEVLESSPEAIIAMDRSFICRAWNAAAERLSGIPREDVLGRNIMSEGIWILGKRMPRQFQEVLNGNVQENIVKAVSPDKQKFVLRQKVSPLKNSEGRVKGILVFLIDVTHEQSGDAKKGKLKTGKDPEFRKLNCMYSIRTASDKAGSLDEFLRLSRELVKQALSNQNECNIEIEFEGGSRKYGRTFPEHKGFSAEITAGIMGTGQLRISGPGSSLSKEDKNLVISAAGIIGEFIARKGSEDLTAQVRHLRSLGKLAGGLAHNLNNILGGILGYTSFVKSGIEQDSPLKEYLDTIEESSTLAADITGQLLELSTEPARSRGIIDINENVRRVTSLMRIFLDRNIIISSKLGPDLRHVEGETSQLDRILISMCLNARESMHAGGKMTISTENVEIKKGRDANTLSLKPGKYVQIDIRDTGIGMSEETILNCFDPFYSTKGLGYGLGLSSAYGIVSSHSGQIIVHSKSGKGTVMSIYLPSVSGPHGKRTSRSAKKPKRTILVVDDEELIRKMVSDGLGSMGYHVLLVTNGDEAISILKSKAKNIDVALIDIIMPGKDYSEVCDQIKRYNKDMKIVLSSGYNLPQGAMKFVDEEGALFIQKPYRLQELSNLIEKAFEQKPKTTKSKKASAKRHPRSRK